jgi:hypothetical protein
MAIYYVYNHFGIFNNHFGIFVAIWVNFSRFGLFFLEKSATLLQCLIKIKKCPFFRICVARTTQRVFMVFSHFSENTKVK